MKIRTGAISVLIIFLISSISPLLVTADSSIIVRQRESNHVFTWDGSASTVEVMGEWDNWNTGTSLSEISTGKWSGDIDLEPGMYCYKFVVDGNWILDPANPYRGYCGSFENSIARVANDTRPMFTHTIENNILSVLWHAGSSGDAPLGTPNGLNGAIWDATNWTWTIDLSGLSNGKHTIHIEGVDASGIPADDLLLPFWIGEESDFIWEDALIYMVDDRSLRQWKSIQ